MAELLHELEASTDARHDEAGVPPRSLQLAELIVAAVVRLVRLGSRNQLADAADDLADVIVGPVADQLEEHCPEALRQVRAAAVTLAAATGPSSSGGEIATLRSWGGNAKRVMQLLTHAQDGTLHRTDLRSALGSHDDSYLSHLLADLEAAGLIERFKAGREVIVQLGPKAETPHVARIVQQADAADREKHEHLIRTVLEAAIAGEPSPEGTTEPEAEVGLNQLRERIRSFRQDAASCDVTIDDVVFGQSHALVTVHVAGIPLTGDRRLVLIDEDITWRVTLNEGRLSNATPLAECDDWLCRPSGEIKPLTGATWFNVDESGLSIDGAGEYRMNFHALRWISTDATIQRASSMAKFIKLENVAKGSPAVIEPSGAVLDPAVDAAQTMR